MVNCELKNRIVSLIKFRCGLGSLQIFNAILLYFSQRLRNSRRSVGQTYSAPSFAGYPRKIHQKAKSSMSLQPHLNFIRT